MKSADIKTGAVTAGFILVVILGIWSASYSQEVKADLLYAKIFGTERPHSEAGRKAAAPLVFNKLGEMESDLVKKRDIRNDLKDQLVLAQEFQRIPNAVLNNKVHVAEKEATRSFRSMSAACDLVYNFPLPDGQPLGKTPPCNPDH